MRILFLLSFALLLTSCSDQKQPEQAPKLNLRPAKFSDLPGWGRDDFRDLKQAFDRSCNRIAKKPPTSNMKSLERAGTYGHWQTICAKFKTQQPVQYKNFFEMHFQPHQILADNEPQGLFTGYYEASLKGSRTKTARYNIPLHARPDDLVMVQLGEFRDELKGQRIAGRVVNGNLKPYETREEIVEGQWPHNDKVLIWVDDAVDAFFVQIQGSGIVEMQDSSTMRIGYAGQNGHVYYAIGRELVKRGELTKENVSMQSIRRWLQNNPNQADEIMNSNESYVFFTEIKGAGPIGGEGIALTAQRSLAIDHSLLPYGVPLWVDIEPPQEGQPRLQRIMMAQDTGGAIRGPVRGDVFWGYGATAEKLAGAMKSKGKYWILLPKTPQ
ncbi:murein transglycosylase A [Alphaproteobacteria bacterium]|nr:murein transglycosylase A [Alphaproteobacteria bacterium]